MIKRLKREIDSTPVEQLKRDVLILLFCTYFYFFLCLMLLLFPQKGFDFMFEDFFTENDIIDIICDEDLNVMFDEMGFVPPIVFAKAILEDIEEKKNATSES